jgi:hypothetical protein
MTIDQIIKKDCSEEEKLGMILSYHMNYMINGDGAITIKVWDKLIADLVSWKNAPENTSSNSDYTKLPNIKDPELSKCIKNIQVAVEKLGKFA